MPCIMVGCPIHICNDPFPHALASIVRKCNPTVYPTVPALIRALVRSQVDPYDLQSIRLWISAGAILVPQDAERFREKFGRTLHNFYGSSETGGIAYDRLGKDTLSGRSVGKPLDGVNCFLSSSNRLVVESPAVFTRKNPRRGHRFGQFLLPDKGTILQDGSIRLEGRRSRIEKIGGKRVSLVEIEKSLLAIAEVKACHVDTYTDSNERTRLGAAVVSELPIETVQTSLKKVLAPWKVPVKWIRLAVMPTNARGKTDRGKIRQLIEEGLPGKEKP